MSLITITEFPLEYENIPLEFGKFRYMTKKDWKERTIAEECNSHLVFLLLMSGCFKEAEECANDLAFFSFFVFKLTTGIWWLFSLVFPVLLTSSVTEDKECVGHLVSLFLMTECYGG